MSQEFSIVGKAVERKEAALKATGVATYSADFLFSGLLAAKVLRSPHPHARVISIDASRAQALKGVVAVATAADLPRARTGRWLYDRTVFAWDRVRHAGEAVAAVAAVDEETAEEALELFKVEYEPLPAIFDPVEAMKPGSLLVHEDMASYRPQKRKCQGNILNQESVVMGDVEAAFARADVIYECRYVTPMTHAGHIQPHQCIASVDATGKLVIWTSTKDPYQIRRQLLEVLDIPMSRIRIIAEVCGGDFGGKGSMSIEGICAALALKARRPVGLTLDWHEELGTVYSRTKAITELKAGARKDGTLLALKGRVIHDCGAYMDQIASNMDGDINRINGPYRIPHVDLSAYMVYTNNPPTGHCRGTRCPQETFPIESHIDGIARKLGMDPIEMRLRNIMNDGDSLPTGGVLRSVSARKVLETTSAYIKKNKGPEEPYTGWGAALTPYNIHTLPGGTQATSAYVKVNEDGTVTLLTGVVEQGSGIVTILMQIAAEELGVSMDQISCISADTDATPLERGTGASQTTYRVGPMVRMAARDAREQILALASRKLEVEPENLSISGGKVFVISAPKVSIPVKQLATEAFSSRGGPIVGTGINLRKEHFKKMEEDKGVVDGPSYGTTAVKVKVDSSTGQIKVLQCYSIWDAGFAINPGNVRGQIEGGVAYGIGYGLSEEIVTKEGKVCNNNLMDYRLPTFSDVPQIESEITEVPSQWGPHGAKGLAEGTNAPAAPALANAVFDATGVRVTELPLNPERVFLALKSRQKEVK